MRMSEGGLPLGSWRRQSARVAFAAVALRLRAPRDLFEVLLSERLGGDLHSEHHDFASSDDAR
jgi:hypothetical protein